MGVVFGALLAAVGFFGFGYLGLITAFDPSLAYSGLLPGVAMMAVSGYQQLKKPRRKRPKASLVREDPENAPPVEIRRHRPEH